MTFFRSVFYLFAAIIIGTAGAEAQSNSDLLARGFSSAGSTDKSLHGNGMTFTPNKGQITDMNGKAYPEVLYKSNTNGADIYIRKTGISYVRSNMKEVQHEIEEELEEKEKAGKLGRVEAGKLKEALTEKAPITIHRLDVDFAGANTNFEMQSSNPAEGYTNYYYAHCPDGITHVNSYNEVTAKNIYNNIDVKYYGGKSSGGLKYDIIVNPGADPGLVKLKYKGYKDIQLKNGNLHIETALGAMEESLPKVYQVINGKVITIKAKYKLDVSHKTLDRREEYDKNLKSQISGLKSEVCEVSFELGVWNHEFPLIIDPYAWATYYGGSGDDFSNGLAVDQLGNTVVTGSTASLNFPVGGSSVYQASIAGQTDAFTVKFSPNGVRLWATYYGGSNIENSYFVACDPFGNVVITGRVAYFDFPVGAAAGNVIYQTAFGGGSDAFVVKFSPTGTRIWATYYGGANSDYGYGVATDLSGNIVITGGTASPAFMTGAIAGNTIFQPIFLTAQYDAFVAKFSPTGARIWATYCGGSSNGDYGQAVAIDATGNVIVTGVTNSSAFPVGAAAGNTVAQPAYGGVGAPDAFIIKFSPAGTRLWATYYGGVSSEYVWDLTTDLSGNIFITGWTISPNLPTGAAAGNTVFQSVYGAGGVDAFVAKFSPTGVRLWATFHGGSRADYGYRCAADNNGNLYVFGSFEDEDSGTFPMNTCALQKTFNSGVIAPYLHEDWFVTKFSPIGNRICSTYIGGSGEEEGEESSNSSFGGIATYQNYVYVTGTNYGGGFPVINAFQNTYAGAGDVIVAKFCGNSCGDNNSITLNFSPSGSVCRSTAVQFIPAVTSALNCDTNSYVYKWYFPGAFPSTSTQQYPGNITFSAAGTYTVSLVVDAICGHDSMAKVITVNNCGCTLSAQPNITANVTCNGRSNGSAQVTASNGTGGPYTYNWSNGASSITTSPTSQISNLVASTYTVTITQGSCSAITGVTITEPPALVTNLSTQWTCPPNTVSVTASVTNGTSPYVYLWSNTLTSQTVTGLSPGNYTVTINDQNGCSAVQPMSLSLPEAMATSITGVNITCTISGSATVFATAGTPTFFYSWSTGQISSGSQTGSGVGQSSIISCPTAGVYTVTITDGVGCTATQTVTITGSSPVSADFIYSTACVGAPVSFTNTGTPTGAGINHTWTISTILPANISGTTTDFSYTFLNDGTYSVSHTVNNGSCSNNVTKKILVVNCSAGPTVSATANSVCAGVCANVSSNPAGGTIPYIYSWSTGATTQNINPCPVSTSTYTVKVTDAAGLTATTTATVTVNPAVSVTVTPAIGCSGATSGSALANPAGGTSPYFYMWNNSQSTQASTSLAQGNYTVTVTDSKGCTASAGTTVGASLTAQFIKGTANCTGCGCKEWIMITALNGSAPYSYLWLGGNDKRYMNKLCPGNYTVNVTDKNGCSVNLVVNAP